MLFWQLTTTDALKDVETTTNTIVTQVYRDSYVLCVISCLVRDVMASVVLEHMLAILYLVVSNSDGVRPLM